MRVRVFPILAVMAILLLIWAVFLQGVPYTGNVAKASMRNNGNGWHSIGNFTIEGGEIVTVGLNRSV